jgi:hypothetical protein
MRGGEGGHVEFKPGSDKIVCEQPYIDTGAIDRALGIT